MLTSQILKVGLMLCLLAISGFLLTETLTSDNANNSEVRDIPITENDSLIEPETISTSLAEPEPVAMTKEDSITIDYLMGKIDPAKDDRFVKIQSRYASSSMYMRKEALSAFIEMHNAAKADGVNLKIISATRPFAHQKRIWEAKWTGKRQVDGKMLDPEVKDAKARALKILRWSSMPSTSRHHWGTDVDINNLNNSYFESGEGLKEYEWLVANASEYDFCQVYSPKGEGGRPYGYEEEKWHWSYLPISRELTRKYAQLISNETISGFLGSEAAVEIDVVKKYVLGINPACK